jgi:hypothetical protein
MSASPFAKHGLRLIQRGYSAIPIRPASKAPGEMRRGEWQNMSNWTRFADRLPSRYEVAVWSTWPGAGIGVAFGPASGDLIGVDIDTDDPEIVFAIRAALPQTTVKKIGATGQAPERRKLNLHMTPIGINDFGDEKRGYSAIDLVIAAKGCDWPTAFETLSSAIGPGRDVTIALRPRGKYEFGECMVQLANGRIGNSRVDECRNDREGTR